MIKLRIGYRLFFASLSLAVGVQAWAAEFEPAPDDPYFAHRKPLFSTVTMHRDVPKGTETLELRVVSAKTGEIVKEFAVWLSSPSSGAFWIWPQEFSDVTSTVLLRELPQGEWRLRVGHRPRHPAGYATHEELIAIPHAGPLEIRLTPREARLRGQVLDDVTGAPLAGVEVTGISYITDESKTATDADGRFLLETLAGVGYETRVTANHPRYFWQTVKISAEDRWPEDIGEIRLVPHATVRGRLVNAWGLPLKRQIVYLVHESLPYTDVKGVGQFVFVPTRRETIESNPSGCWGEDQVRTCLTNDQGAFVSTAMRPGKYTAVFGDLRTSILPIEVEEGQQVEVTLQKR